jgi:nucleoside permease NupC
MGVDWEDCGIVGELLGIKTFANEFIAYADLSKYIKNANEDNGGRILMVSHLESCCGNLASYFNILCCLMPDNFTCQGGVQLVNGQTKP